MTTRRSAIATLCAAGLLAGAALHLLAPGVLPTLPWYGHLLLAAGLALAVPMLLGSVGSSGGYQAMARLWSAVGALGILLLGAGVAAAGLAMAQGGTGPRAWLLVSLGAGLLAGLGLVKLSLRRVTAQRGG